MAPKKRKPRVEYGWKPLEPVEINAYEPGRTDYTQEENYEAYKVFCIMDIDNSGCVSNREVRRLLTGHREKFITFEFDHPDTGIIWGLDKEDNVIVKSVEPFSPASKRVEIVRGFRLRQVNGVMLPQKDKNGLKVLHKELIRAAHGSVIFQVYEPSFILNRFSTSLDIEVDGVVYSVTLPVGAMNDLPEFEREIEKTLASTNKLLSRIKVSIDPVSKAVKFYSTEFPFRLLFATGPNYQTSCRYALGFWAYDFPYDLEHSGQPLYIDLKLDLTEVELDILLDELFESFDSDGSGEFRFEEFRNFYIQFLCNDEKLALLKKYAAYRFRDLEEEARLMNIMNNRRKRIERKRNRASKNAVQIKKMEQTLKDKTRLDEDHVRRRIYDHKKEEHITRRYNKVRNGISLPLKDSEETAIVEKKEKAPPESPVSEELQKSRERNKLVTLKQQLARNLKLHKIFEDDHQRKARAMQETAESERQQYLLHMGDLIDTFRRCLGEDGGRMKSVDGPNGEPRYTLRYDHVVRSPAVKMLSKTPEPNYLTDIDLIDLSSSELHPAAKTYFMIKNEPGREFDSSLIHPSFFGAQFERERSKAPHVGLGAARSFMQDIGASGVEISPKLRHRNPDFWSLPIAVRGQDWIRKKEKLKKKYSASRIEQAEKIAQEVVSCAITWGLAMATINLAKKRLVPPVEEVVEEDPVQIALARLNEALESMKPLPRPNSQTRHSVPTTADSMTDVNDMFDAAFNSMENENGTRVELAGNDNSNDDKFGRFGPDELFQEEPPNTPKAGFNKRTIAAGFWLEKEAYQPLKRHRSTPLHESGLTGEENVEDVNDVYMDPGGVNTMDPVMSSQLLKSLSKIAKSKPSSDPTLPGVLEGAKSLSWGVVGPATAVEIGPSLDATSGTAAWTPSRSFGLVSPEPVVRPATAYGLDDSVYKDGQGSKYAGFVHIPVPLSNIPPVRISPTKIAMTELQKDVKEEASVSTMLQAQDDTKSKASDGPSVAASRQKSEPSPSPKHRGDDNASLASTVQSSKNSKSVLSLSSDSGDDDESSNADSRASLEGMNDGDLTNIVKPSVAGVSKILSKENKPAKNSDALSARKSPAKGREKKKTENRGGGGDDVASVGDDDMNDLEAEDKFSDYDDDVSTSTSSSSNSDSDDSDDDSSSDEESQDTSVSSDSASNIDEDVEMDRIRAIMTKNRFVGNSTNDKTSPSIMLFSDHLSPPRFRRERERPPVPDAMSSSGPSLHQSVDIVTKVSSSQAESNSDVRVMPSTAENSSKAKSNASGNMANSQTESLHSGGLNRDSFDHIFSVDEEPKPYFSVSSGHEEADERDSDVESEGSSSSSPRQAQNAISLFSDSTDALEDETQDDETYRELITLNSNSQQDDHSCVSLESERSITGKISLASQSIGASIENKSIRSLEDGAEGDDISLASKSYFAGSLGSPSASTPIDGGRSRAVSEDISVYSDEESPGSERRARVIFLNETYKPEEINSGDIGDSDVDKSRVPDQTMSPDENHGESSPPKLRPTSGKRVSFVDHYSSTSSVDLDSGFDENDPEPEGQPENDYNDDVISLDSISTGGEHRQYPNATRNLTRQILPNMPRPRSALSADNYSILSRDEDIDGVSLTSRSETSSARNRSYDSRLRLQATWLSQYGQVDSDVLSLMSYSDADAQSYRQDDEILPQRPADIFDDAMSAYSGVISLSSRSFIDSSRSGTPIKNEIPQAGGSVSSSSPETVDEDTIASSPVLNKQTTISITAQLTDYEDADHVSEVSEARPDGVPSEHQVEYEEQDFTWALFVASTARMVVESVVKRSVTNVSALLLKLDDRDGKYIMEQIKDLHQPWDVAAVVALETAKVGLRNVLTSISDYYTREILYRALNSRRNAAIAAGELESRNIVDALDTKEVVREFANAAVNVYMDEAVFGVMRLAYYNFRGELVYYGRNDQLDRDGIIEFRKYEKKALRKEFKAKRRLEKLKAKEKKLKEKELRREERKEARRKAQEAREAREKARAAAILRRREGIFSHHSALSSARFSEVSEVQKEELPLVQTQRVAQIKAPIKPIRAGVKFLGFKIITPTSMLKPQSPGEYPLFYLTASTPNNTWSARTVPKIMDHQYGGSIVLDNPAEEESVTALHSFISSKDRPRSPELPANSDGLGITNSALNDLQIGEVGFESTVADATDNNIQVFQSSNAPAESEVLLHRNSIASQTSTNNTAATGVLQPVIGPSILPHAGANPPMFFGSSKLEHSPLASQHFSGAQSVHSYGNSLKSSYDGPAQLEVEESVDLEDASETYSSYGRLEESTAMDRTLPQDLFQSSVELDDYTIYSREISPALGLHPSIEIDNLSSSKATKSNSISPRLQNDHSGSKPSASLSEDRHSSLQSSIEDSRYGARLPPKSEAAKTDQNDGANKSDPDGIPLNLRASNREEEDCLANVNGGRGATSDSRSTSHIDLDSHSSYKPRTAPRIHTAGTVQSGISEVSGDFDDRVVPMRTAIDEDIDGIPIEGIKSEFSSAVGSGRVASALDGDARPRVARSRGAESANENIALSSQTAAPTTCNSSAAPSVFIPRLNIPQPVGSISAADEMKSYGDLSVMSSDEYSTVRTESLEFSDDLSRKYKEGFTYSGGDAVEEIDGVDLTSRSGSFMSLSEYDDKSVGDKSDGFSMNSDSHVTDYVLHNLEMQDDASRISIDVDTDVESDAGCLAADLSHQIIENRPFMKSSGVEPEKHLSESLEQPPRPQILANDDSVIFDEMPSDPGMAAEMWWPELEDPEVVEFNRALSSLLKELAIFKLSDWNTASLKIYQSMNFEIRDGNTTELLGFFSISFKDLVEGVEGKQKVKKTIKVAVKIVSHRMIRLVKPTEPLQCINLRGIMTIEVDTNDPPTVFEEYNIEHFQQHRGNHWTTYPPSPLNMGIIRQKYRDVAKQYDSQRIVHPTLFGFRVRYIGHEKNEALFTHPMFTGYRLGRKPATTEQMDAYYRNHVKELHSNPWKWQPGLEKLGLCPICTNGTPGCPRCFSMPLTELGEMMRPVDFQFDPEKELAKRAAKEAMISSKLQSWKMEQRTKRFLIDAGAMSDKGSDDGNETDEEEMIKRITAEVDKQDGSVRLHTQLTTGEAIRLWRSIVQVRLEVWIKVMPVGEVRKFGIDASDPVWHLHNMFLSHSEYGNSKNGKLLLPTASGFFEIDNELEYEDENVRTLDAGRIQLKRYGLKQRDKLITLMYFPQYNKPYVPLFFKTFFNQNVDSMQLEKEIPVHRDVYFLPLDLDGDSIQKHLRVIYERHHIEQQLHYKSKMRQKQLEFSDRLKAKGIEESRKAKIEKETKERSMRGARRRLESQLKGLVGASKDFAIKNFQDKFGVIFNEETDIKDSALEEAKRRLSKRQGKFEALKANRLRRPTLNPVLEGMDEEREDEDSQGTETTSEDDDVGKSDGSSDTDIEVKVPEVSKLAKSLASTLKQSPGFETGSPRPLKTDRSDDDKISIGVYEDLDTDRPNSGVLPGSVLKTVGADPSPLLTSRSLSSLGSEIPARPRTSRGGSESSGGSGPTVLESERPMSLSPGSMSRSAPGVLTKHDVDLLGHDRQVPLSSRSNASRPSSALNSARSVHSDRSGERGSSRPTRPTHQENLEAMNAYTKSLIIGYGGVENFGSLDSTLVASTSEMSSKSQKVVLEDSLSSSQNKDSVHSKSSKTESFVLKKREITQIEEYNLKSAINRQADFLFTGEVYPNAGDVSGAMRSSRVDMPGIMPSGPVPSTLNTASQISAFANETSEDIDRRGSQDRGTESIDSDDDSFMAKTFGISSSDSKVESFEVLKDVEALRDTAADVKVRRIGTDSENQRKEKSKIERKNRKAAKLQMEEAAKAAAATSGEPVDGPLMHKHSRGIEVTRPYGKGFWNRLKPLPGHASSVANLQNADAEGGEASPATQEYKYSTGFLKFINPLFRKAHTEK